MKPVAIVGGGISGLAAAYYLGRHGVPSRIYERRSLPGGTVRTEKLEGCLVEAGPDSWLAAKEWMLEFVRELGMGDQVMGSNDSRRRTYVVRDGCPVPLPDGMGMLAPSKPWQALSTPLYGSRTKMRMALELFRRPARRDDRSAAELVRDHFGQEMVEYVAQPMLAGVYGSPPERLSAQSVLPRLVDHERCCGSILRGALRHPTPPRNPLFLTLREGMGSLIRTLQQQVAGTCELVRAEVREVRPATGGWQLCHDHGADSAGTVMLATPAHEAGRLLRAADGRLAELLRGIGYTSSIVAGLVYPKSGFGHPLDGFGMLVPRVERGSLAACTWVNTKFDGRVPADKVLLRAFLADADAERALSESDSSVLRVADEQLRGWMGFRSAPVAGLVQRWRQAMPRYDVGHAARVREVEARLRGQPGLHLGGNGYTGLGLPDCVRRSRGIAEAIAAGSG